MALWLEIVAVCTVSALILCSSLPVGAAQLSTAAQQNPPTDFSVFDALRDTIYSEVATLIANNEARPHFLVSPQDMDCVVIIYIHICLKLHCYDT